MKVRELVEKLLQADQDLEVFASPIVYVPDLNGGLNQIVDPASKYRVENLMYIREFDKPSTPESIIVAFTVEKPTSAVVETIH